MEGPVNTRDLVRVGFSSSDDSLDFLAPSGSSVREFSTQCEHSPPTATTQPPSSKARQRRARKLRLPSRTAAPVLPEAVHFSSDLRATATSFQPPSGCTTHAAFDTDAQCCALVNQVFIDPDFGKCTITHWDAEGGDRRIFYRADSSQIETVSTTLHTTLELALHGLSATRNFLPPREPLYFGRR